VRAWVGARGRWLPLVVAGAAVAAFLPALGAGFVNWDDEVSFLANPYFRGLGAAQLRWMVTTTLLGHWSPLAWMTWGLDYVLWGLDPRGYHLTSLLLHAANAALFYLVARRLLAAGFSLSLPEGKGTGAVAAGALVAALVFAVHPLRAESVVWVSERRDVLCGLFYLLSVLAYLRGVAAGAAIGRRWWVASVAAFAAALSSKAIAMTLPLSLLVMDMYPLDRRRVGWRGLLVEKVPYGVLAAGAAAIAVATRQESGNITGYEQYGAHARAALAGYALWFYPWKLVSPGGLSPMYEMPLRIDLAQWRFLGPLIGVVAVTGVLVLLRRRWPGGLAGWAHSAIVLAPISGVVHSGSQLAHDRYSYLSGLGFAVLAGAALTWVLVRAPAAAGAARPRWPSRAAVALALLVVAALGTAAWSQAGIWRDSETLWRRAVALDPACAICLSNLGRVIAQPGRFEEAEAHVRQAIALRPDRPGPYENLGVIALAQGRQGEAEAHFRRVATIRPAHGASRNNLGVALAGLGRDLEAEAEFREAARLSSRLIDAPANLGALYLRQGRHAEAIAPLRAALALDAGATRVRARLARALQGRADELLREGRQAEARPLAQEAAELARGLTGPPLKAPR